MTSVSKEMYQKVSLNPIDQYKNILHLRIIFEKYTQRLILCVRSILTDTWGVELKIIL
jgi:DICT domain-containing protein